jgi:NADH-quinone oxidoreductase subunit J
MNGSTIIFYLLAAMTLISAILAVTSRRIFRAAIYLLFSLVGVAGIYFWLSYDFIAAVQIVVYVGGITVLIIFSIFLTQQAGELLPKPNLKQNLLSAIAVICGFILTMMQVLKYEFPVNREQSGASDISIIGARMLDTGHGGYALPFELVSILLLAAMVGCIVLAIRTRPQEG